MDLPPSPSSSLSINTQNPAKTKTTVLAYTGRDLSIIKSIPPSIGAIIPPILERAEAIPHAVPRTFVPKISGVQPYNTAHIVVTLRLIPTVLALTAHVDSTSTNTTQKNAVMKVLPARDHLRPNLVSMSHAPRMAPGHPPIVKITTSHKLCSSVFVGGTDCTL